MSDKISLYPDQEEFIQEIRKLWKHNNRIVAMAATGFGKTRCAAKIIEGCTSKGLKVCFVVPRISLIGQTIESFNQLGIDDITVQWGDNEIDERALVTIASADTMIRRDKRDYDLVVIDECFTGDMEVLTSEGWIRFDQLGEQKVAQSCVNGGIDYVKPIKIKKKYDGEMVNFSSNKLINMDCTASHEMVIHRPKSVSKIEAKSVNLNTYNRLLAAGSSEVESKELTPRERFLIAAQADGSIHATDSRGGSLIYFSFAKQRKINRLRDICTDAGYRINEISSREGLRRFSVKIPFTIQKNLSKDLDLNISKSKAREIVSEASEWDGHKISDTSLYYSSTIKDNSDYLQAVCVLAGYKSNLTVQKDSRKESYKDVYRLFISINQSSFTTSNIKKTKYSYKGDVYCVRVPKGNIFVRRNGKPVLVGNCHKRKKKILEWMIEHPHERYIGLTATPFAGWMGQYYTALAKSKSVRWLIDNKRLAEFEIYAPYIPDVSKARTRNTSSGKDFVESDIEAIMGDAKVVGNVVDFWFENGNNEITMALCVNVKHAHYLAVEFNKHGVTSEVITAKTKIEDRELIKRRVRDGITRVLLSVDCLTEGFDMPETTCLINARPTKSLIRYVQGMGRVLRYMPGKVAKIFDHSGSTIELGAPDTIDIDYLRSDSDGLQDAAKAEKKDKPEKIAKACPKCAYLKEPGQHECPKCGFKPEIFENVETNESMTLAKVDLKGKKVTKFDKQQFYSELLGWQKERKWRGRDVSNGYLAHLYKHKFGVWPRSLENRPVQPSPSTINFIKHRQIAYKKRMLNEDNRRNTGKGI